VDPGIVRTLPGSRRGWDVSARPALPDQRRRRVIATVAVVAGAALVGATLRLPRGSAGFYAAGFTLAAVWVIAAIACGDVRRPSAPGRRFDLTLGVIVGVVTFIGFVIAAEIGQHISILAGPINSLLEKADAGPVIAVLALALVNAVAEELFFRGVLVDAIGGRWAAALSVVVYVAVTAVAGNTALTIAALVMGVVWTAQRIYTNARTASIVTHLVWSTLMILALPR